MHDKSQSLGAFPSPRDLRTFSYYSGAIYDVKTGGKRYLPQDIEDQSKVGLCTSISLTQNARKAFGGSQWSADFLYLIQKKYFDKNWIEGSSIFHALKAAYNYGFLPAQEWRHTTQADRDAGYATYIKKLQAIPQTEIDRLIAIAKSYKLITAYASVPIVRSELARAIDESKAGILVRFDVGKEWWSSQSGISSWKKQDLEPLRPPRVVVSGHAVTESNFDGDSFRIANTWSKDWADQGTAYHLLREYEPTEAFAIWYWDEKIPKEIEKQIESRSSLIGKIVDMLQMIIELVKKLA